MTRWVSPAGEKPTSYAEFMAKQGPPTPFTPVPISSFTRSPKDSGRILLIMVQLQLQIFIQNKLDVYMSDIAKEGFVSEVYASVGGTPEDIRDFLVSEYYEKYGSAFAGVLLIGDFPVPWYEVYMFCSPLG